MLDSETMQRFGAAARDLRHAMGHDLQQVAAAAELEEVIVQEIENGERIPTLPELRALAATLGCVVWLAPRTVGPDDFGIAPLTTWRPS